MGQAILYCYRCSTQLREANFEQGKAFRIDTRACCADCAPEAIRTLPPEVVQSLMVQLKGRDPLTSSSASTRRVAPRQAASGIRPAVPGSSGIRGAWVVAALVAVILGILAIVSLSSGPSRPETDSSRSPRPAPPPSIAPPRRPAPNPAETAVDRNDPAHLALKSAWEYARTHPDDLSGQLRLFEDLTLAGDKGDAGEEARRLSKVLRAKGKEAVERELAKLDVELAGPLAREAFSSVRDLLGSKASLMDWPEWKLGINKRSLDLDERVEKLYEPLKEKAKAAKAQGNVAALDPLFEQVRSWGFESRTKDLLDVLALIDMPPVRVVLQDFAEASLKGLKYIGGEEFRGAKGSATVDAAVLHGAHRSYRLEADFRAGGAYVGFFFDMSALKQRQVRELHFWIKTATSNNIGVRLADESGQILQRNGGVNLAKTAEWQEIVLKVSDFQGNEHWGGANDGRWHGPMRGLGVNVGKGSFRTVEQHGVLWIADIEGMVVPTWTPRKP